MFPLVGFIVGGCFSISNYTNKNEKGSCLQYQYGGISFQYHSLQDNLLKLKNSASKIINGTIVPVYTYLACVPSEQ